MNVHLFKFRCNIFIGVRVIKEMPGFGSEWDTLYMSVCMRCRRTKFQLAISSGSLVVASEKKDVLHLVNKYKKIRIIFSNVLLPHVIS
jgi:hypothetical protein